MKPNTKSHKKGGKGKGSRRGKRGRRLSGLGVVKSVAVQIAKDAVNPLAILLGYGAGAAIGRGLDTVAVITPDPLAEGFQVKSLAKPAILLIGGIAITATAHHLGTKGGKQQLSMGGVFAKNFGYGLTVSGGVALVKGVIKKDIFDGLGAAGQSVDAKYLEESKALLRQLVEQASNEPSLPELNEGNMDGLSSTTIPLFDAERQGTIL